jgi:MurNAc alpha-1-phosphate uridylyltransferase
MILAAGRGERMRPLTNTTPKPLLRVGGRRLIEWHLLALARAGVTDVVVNHAMFGAQIVAALGDGASWGLRIHYSDEGDTALETGGGVYQALDLLGPDPFIVVNGDVWTDFDYRGLVGAGHASLDAGALAMLVLVPNPPQHARGDFCLAAPTDSGTRWILDQPFEPRYTYSGIAVYRPQFFAGCTAGRFPLLPLFRRAAQAGRLEGRLYEGLWFDIGTPQRLAALDAQLAGGANG